MRWEEEGARSGRRDEGEEVRGGRKKKCEEGGKRSERRGGEPQWGTTSLGTKSLWQNLWGRTSWSMEEEVLGQEDGSPLQIPALIAGTFFIQDMLPSFHQFSFNLSPSTLLYSFWSALIELSPPALLSSWVS